MYVAAAGINPQRTVIGLEYCNIRCLSLARSLFTHAERRDLGLRQPCLEGKEYLSIVDEFMEAIHTCWPKAIVQFEDFQMKRAFERLQRYQKKGTAGVALAGLLGTVRAQDRPLTDLVNQKIVVVGAGSAGLGVFNMAAQAVSRMAGAEANPLFFLLDKDGLITTESKGVDPAAAPFAKAPGEIEGLGLRVGANLVKVKKVKPHVLLGLSGVGGVFNKQGMEVGHVNQANQANNMYLFPGIKMGTLLSGAHLISDGMSQAASECIQDITAEVGAAIVRAVVAEELAEGRCDVGPRELRRRWWNMSNATCGFQFTALLFMRNKVPIISVCVRAGYFSTNTVPTFCSHSNIHDATVVLKPRIVIW